MSFKKDMLKSSSAQARILYKCLEGGIINTLGPEKVIVAEDKG